LRRPSARGNKPPEPVALDIKRDIPRKQLAGIGALALAYNELEAVVDKLFFISTDLSKNLQLEVLTRINGVDGTIEIIKEAAKLYLSEEEHKHLAEALGDGGFKLLKSYRDSVIHVRHLNYSSSVGVRVDRRARVFDVLVSQNALDAAFELLEALRMELFWCYLLISSVKSMNSREPGDPKIKQLEPATENFRLLFKEGRRERLSLQPLPEFPSESELREAAIRFQQDVRAKMVEMLIGTSQKNRGK
jgi:hypothetical protein